MQYVVITFVFFATTGILRKGAVLSLCHLSSVQSTVPVPSLLGCTYVLPVVLSQSSSLPSKLEEFCEQHGINLSSLKTVVKSLFFVLKSRVFSCCFHLSNKLHFFITAI